MAVMPKTGKMTRLTEEAFQVFTFQLIASDATDLVLTLSLPFALSNTNG